MSFEQLKQNRESAIAKLTQAAKATTEKKDYGDDRFWKPTVDKAGNGYAVIRFLPGAEGDDLPWVRYWDHGFKGSTGRWYIEKSLTSIGKEDPVSELNSQLWNTGREEDKEIARSRKRRLHHVSNILVVSDSANPENEGKVFLYKFGKRIFDKINDQMNPEFEDESPVNPFDLWEGANFKMKIRNVEGYRNYDKSEFDAQSPLLDDDDELEKIWGTQYSLQEFVDPKNFKSYEELQARLNRVLGASAVSSTAEEVDEDISPEPRQAAAPKVEEEESSWSEESSDDSLDFFKQLAEED